MDKITVETYSGHVVNFTVIADAKGNVDLDPDQTIETIGSGSLRDAFQKAFAVARKQLKMIHETNIDDETNQTEGNESENEY